MVNENEYQSKLIKKIKEEFPGAMVIKQDPNYIQGIPDLLVLFGSHWAALETKRSEDAPHRPNQDYYVSHMNKMSFARFIYPENEEEILDELQSTFRFRRMSRILITKQVSLDKL